MTFFVSADADYAQPTLEVAKAIDGNLESGYGAGGHEKPRRANSGLHARDTLWERLRAASSRCDSARKADFPSTRLPAFAFP